MVPGDMAGVGAGYRVTDLRARTVWNEVGVDGMLMHHTPSGMKLSPDELCLSAADMCWQRTCIFRNHRDRIHMHDRSGASAANREAQQSNTVWPDPAQRQCAECRQANDL